MNRSSLIYDLMEPIRPSVDWMLYQFMAKTNLRVSDFFETRQGICKVMPELVPKIVPLVRSLDPDINRVVKEFASNFKNRRMEAPPDEYRKFVMDGNDSLDTVGAVVQN
jgi:CRISPR/Cas system-associated endonuclease Cas1